MTRNPRGDDIPGSYSPDGRWISFVRDRFDENGDPVAIGLFLVRPDGTGLRRLTAEGVPTNPEHGGRWAPDGRTILFDARPDDASRFTLWTIRPTGRHLRRIPVPLSCGGLLDDPTSFGCFAPAWAPSGQALAFGTLDAATGARDLYSVHLDGSHLVRLTQGTLATGVPDWTG